MGWFSGGDKHTGARVGGPSGRPVTDKQARQIIRSEDGKRGINAPANKTSGKK
jgi:hypothetical protein